MEKACENITFVLNDNETKRCKLFIEEHKQCRASSMGEKIMVSFIPNSLGDCVVIRCLSCGKHEDITDIEKF